MTSSFTDIRANTRSISPALLNPVLPSGNEALLAKAISRGNLEGARIHITVHEIYDGNKKFFDSIRSGNPQRDLALQQMKNLGLECRTVTAVLSLVFRDSPAAIKEIIISNNLTDSKNISATSLLSMGLGRICKDLKIERRPAIWKIIDFLEQEHCHNVLEHLASWGKNPTSLNPPRDVIKLSLPALTQFIPWLRGRGDQLVGKYRALLETGKISGSRSSNIVYAWFDVRKDGVITLTISAKDKSESQLDNQDFNPILACYMIGAAAHRSGLDVNVFKTGFTDVTFFSSRTDAISKLKELYPAMGEGSVRQEALLMLVGGAFDITSFQEPIHLKTVKRPVTLSRGQSTISSTACFAPISSLNINAVSDSSNPNAEIASRYGRSTVSLPWSLISGTGIRKCQIMIGRELLHHVVFNRSFIGGRFELQGVLGNGSTKKIGKLLFKSREPNAMPQFIFESNDRYRNSRQAAIWAKLVFNWLQSAEAKIPLGGLDLKVSRNGEKNHANITFDKQHITLVNFPKEINDLIAVPAQLANKVSDRYVLLYSKDGRLVAVLARSNLIKNRKLRAYNPFSTRDPTGRVADLWGALETKSKKVWTALILS